MRKIFLFYGLLSLVLASCQPQKQQLRALEQKIDKLGVLAQNISDTSSIQSLDSTSQLLNRVQEEMNQLSILIKQDALSEKHQVLQQTLKQHAPKILAFQQDPSLYNIGGIMKAALANPKAELSQKINQVSTLLQRTPAYYESAKKKLTPSSIPQLELAIRKQSLGLQFLQQELRDSLDQLSWTPENNTLFAQHQSKAQLAMKDYIAWCNSQIIESAAQTQGLK